MASNHHGMVTLSISMMAATTSPMGKTNRTTPNRINPSIAPNHPTIAIPSHQALRTIVAESKGMYGHPTKSGRWSRGIQHITPAKDTTDAPAAADEIGSHAGRVDAGYPGVNQITKAAGMSSAGRGDSSRNGSRTDQICA